MIIWLFVLLSTLRNGWSILFPPSEYSIRIVFPKNKKNNAIQDKLDLNNLKTIIDAQITEQKLSLNTLICLHPTVNQENRKQINTYEPVLIKFVVENLLQ